jgi:hypothetical protein
MFRLSVLQNQWLILALAAGLVVMLAVVMTYLMMWRPRKETGEVISDLRSLFHLLPLIVIILFICIVIYQITYVIIFALNPPNI